MEENASIGLNNDMNLSLSPEKLELEASAVYHAGGNFRPGLVKTKSFSSIVDKGNIDQHRERNRQHAKKTRQRKKEMIDGTKNRLLELQQEARRLEELLEETNTASILMGLSATNPLPGPSQEYAKEPEPNMKITKGNIVDELRQQVRLETAQKLKKAQDEVSIVSQSENDDLVDERYVDAEEMDDSSSIVKLDFPREEKGTPRKEADIKRERNKMHAKLTRERRKLFHSKMQLEILSLERNNQTLREKLILLTPLSRSGYTSSSAISTSDSSSKAGRYKYDRIIQGSELSNINSESEGIGSDQNMNSS